MNKVAILGVGMIRFGMYPNRSVHELACEAGNAALDEAARALKDVDAV
jgi:acetyl-CoA acetyltransferase